MSFASESKKELVLLKVNDCCAKAELSALIRMNGVVTLSSNGLSIDFQSQNAAIARRVVMLIKQLFDVHIDLLTRKRMRLNKGNIYIVRIREKTKEILREIAVMSDKGFEVGITESIVSTECCKRGYLRGAFLASGSVNNPETSSYHLEVFTLDEEHANGLVELMNYFNLNGRVIKRKKGYIAYIKESEKISDYLRVIEAINAVFDFEDVRIVRDMNNSVNRIRNCDIANLNKSWNATRQQIENIKLIDSVLGLDYLNEKLYDIAIMRLKYPDVTLQELSDLSYEELPKGVSKSGVNHRLRKINELASRIIESQKANNEIDKEEIEKYK